jgi:hypothetical protein
MARVHLKSVIEALAREFGRVSVILQFSEVEKCDMRCQQANPKTFYECTCSCLAANHGGVGGGAAWLQVGETTLINPQVRESRFVVTREQVTA